MSELNAKNTLISRMAVVKDLKVPHGSREVVKQKLSFLLLSVIAVLAETQPVSIKNLQFAKTETETETRPSNNASKARPRPLKSDLETGLETKTNLVNAT